MKFYAANVVLLWVTAVAFAAPPYSKPRETVEMTIQLGDLDLKTARGMRVARERIAAAARRLCDRFRNTSRVSDSETTADCQRDAVADAVQRLQQSSQPLVRNSGT